MLQEISRGAMDTNIVYKKCDCMQASHAWRISKYQIQYPNKRFCTYDKTKTSSLFIVAQLSRVSTWKLITELENVE